MVVFTFATARGRQTMRDPEPWLAVVLFAIVVFPHGAWLQTGYELIVSGFNEGVALAGGMKPAAWLWAALVFSHLGLFLLVVLASGWPGHGRRWRDRAPEFTRAPVEFLARSYVYFFALAPGLCAVAIAFAAGKLGPLDRVAPLLVLSGLAVIVLAGDQVLLYRERLVSSAWAGLLIVPPALVVLGLSILPWTFAVDQKIAQPANAEGRFFADNFQRRTGRPLAIVAGDPHTAALIALEAPSRPSLLMDEPERSPWVGLADVQEKGAVVVWPATDRAGTPPPSIKTLFPDLVVEVPRVFERRIEGRLPLLRIGWAVIRPQSEAPASPSLSPQR
jgi:hypothetical protein